MRTVDWKIIEGDCRDVLRAMPAQSVHTVVTSPPYFGLRDYGTGEWEGGDPACDHRPTSIRDGRNEDRPTMRDGVAATNAGQLRHWAKRQACETCGATKTDRQIGLEPTPDEFVQALVEVFREVWRVLRDDGTVWLNLGDSFCSTDKWGGGKSGNSGKHTTNGEDVPSWAVRRKREHYADAKPKDLLGIPWMVAFALRADGWYLRSDIVWSKPNPMPESVTDRPTKAHEYVFLLSKGPRYFYDADAIREEASPATVERAASGNGRAVHSADNKNRHRDGADRAAASSTYFGRDFAADVERGRNKRSVWTVATQPYAGAHFATFPPKLIEPCVLAGAPERACGECGAPWVRVVETSGGTIGQSWHNHEGDLARGQRGGDNGNIAAEGWKTYKRETRGFEPSCSHGDGSARGVVLDPFAGAGTTGLVALQQGRDFVGIELSPEYARMARERIETAVRLGFRAPTNGAEQIPGQLVLE